MLAAGTALPPFEGIKRYLQHKHVLESPVGPKPCSSPNPLMGWDRLCFSGSSSSRVRLSAGILTVARTWAWCRVHSWLPDVPGEQRDALPEGPPNLKQLCRYGWQYPLEVPTSLHGPQSGGRGMRPTALPNANTGHWYLLLLSIPPPMSHQQLVKTAWTPCTITAFAQGGKGTARRDTSGRWLMRTSKPIHDGTVTFNVTHN